MKTLRNSATHLIITSGALCLLSVLLTSCLKKQDVYVPPAAYISAVQACPDAPRLSFYLNNDLVNNQPLNFGDVLSYVRAYTGKRTLTFYDVTQHKTLVSDTATLQQDMAYSLFLTNTAANPQMVLLTDTLTKPQQGYAGIRFVNVSPDAPAADLAIKGGSVLVSNKAFKGYSGFVKIPGGQSYNLEIRQTGTSTVLATLPMVKINNGYVCTVWLQGLAGSSNTAAQLSAKFILNTYY